MTPQPRLAIVATVQQAITTLLTTYEPEFLRFGYSLFIAFATILIVWQGIRMMLSQDSLSDHLFEFAKLLLFISFGYALVAFYESPIPGIGVSFSNLITDQAQAFANILDARSLELVFDHLDQLWQQFVQPDAWSILANLLYWLLLILVTLAKVASLAVVAFGLIASAVCALVGPIFVPFFIVPKLDWLFWSWFKAFIQYSFVPVIALAFLMVFERFIYQYLTTLPPGITEDLYMLYGIQAFVIVGVFTFGILLVPSLTSSIFSGRGGESIFPDRFVRF
ncbi:MAG TPA: type IV secretion system protein [Vicinamibacterales bacterium]|nr:type IV secretion system protein [Vicinamibacterales bacterium]